MKRLTITAILLASAIGSSVRADPAAEAILKECGIRGGLVVQIGIGDGQATASLRANDSLLVQGLDTDAAAVAEARKHFRSLGLMGVVSARVFDGRRLPYADNLVNLVVAPHLGDVAMTEVIRVLCPGGMVYVPSDDGWKRTVKPWPEEIDEWTHYLHGPDNNAVAQDSVVGPPQHFQWISGPRFSRTHDHLASVSAVVSAGGRLFSVVDQGSIAFAAASPRWRLVARDAFNGVMLWEREISTWEYHLRDFRSGPADIARRLVAVGNRVYVTLGYDQPVVALDAATGETVHTYRDTEGTQEILADDGTLLLVLGERDDDWRAEQAKQIVSQPGYKPPFERYTPPARNMRVMSVDAASGHGRWTNSEPYTRSIMPSTLATSGNRVYFQNTEAVVCLDGETGQQVWQTPRPIHRQRLAWSTPTLVVHKGVVFSADRRAAQPDEALLWMPSGGYHEYIRGEDVDGQLIALDAQTGKRLWSCPAYEGFNAPVDVMIADNLLWTGRYAWGEDPGITEARDPKTGEVRRSRPPDQDFLPRIGHARCHRAKATSQYLILGRRGVEFVDLKTGGMVANLWVRGICQYGVMPANGLLYVPPHSCACDVGDMLKSGFMALAPKRGADVAFQGVTEAEALHKGPAYASIPSSSSPLANSSSWPTYRHDPMRSGVTETQVGHDLKIAWQTDLGGKLTSPVASGGRLLVAQSDRHCVNALNTVTGEIAWTFVAGARIDSPPTVDGQRVLFGSADGFVYCLRLNDGQLIWKFQAAPEDRSIVVNDQLESAWPVSGSVLVIDGSVFFTAGRNSYLDGGMFLYKLDAVTGRVRQVQALAVEQEKRDEGHASGGYLPDVLSSDGESIFLRSARFDLDLVRQKDNVPHLWSSVGFLDDTWWHRTYWQYGTSMSSGWSGWAKAGQRVPAGRLLATDGSRLFGFGRNQYDTPGAHPGVDADGVWGPIGREMGRWTFYELFGQSLDSKAGKQSRRGEDDLASNRKDWKRRIPILGQGLTLAGETLFIAGPPDVVRAIPQEPAEVDPLAAALESTRGGTLLAVSSVNGQTLGEVELSSPPVFDGMIAAGERLYLSTKCGHVVCLGSRQ